MRKLTKILSLLLSLCLVLSFFPAASADGGIEQTDPAPAEEQGTIAPVTEGTIDPAALSREPAADEIQASSGTCGENLTWTLDDNGVLTISGTGDMWNYEQYRGPGSGASSIVVEEGVTSIGDNAFDHVSTVTSVTLPASLQRIGTGAFQACTALTKVSMQEGLTTLGERALAQCPITDITIPASVVSFGDFSLVFTSGDPIHPEPCTCVIRYNGTAAQWRALGGSFAVDNYSARILCTDGAIPRAEHNQCGDEITWTTSDNTLFVTGTGDMWGEPAWSRWWGDSTTQRACLSEGITSIGYRTFHSRTALTSIELPSTLRRIKNLAFQGSNSLKTITLPASIEVLDDMALAGCNLTEIYFQGSAPSLGERCFGGLTATVYYPAGDPSWTEEIRQDYMGTITWAAYDAHGAQNVTSGDCGDALTWTLDDQGTLTVTGTGPMWEMSGTVELWQSYKSSIRSVQVEEGASTLCDKAFSGCVILTSVSLPESLKTIGSYAFSGCTALPSIRLPESLETIGGYAFESCSALEEILLPKGVKTLGDFAFWDCALQSITVSEENSCFCISDGVLYNKDMTALLFCPAGNTFASAVPETVTAIGAGAFAPGNGMEMITLPAGLASIGSKAFYNCRALKEIHFTGTAPEIASDAFYCVEATAFYPAGDASWTAEIRQSYGGNITWHEGEYAILGSGKCGENASWSLNEVGVLTISGSGPMWDYTLTQELDQLPPWRRYHSQDVREIRIEEGITRVGNYAFSGFLDNAASVRIPISLPDGLREIGQGAFYSSIVSGEICIPGSVESIGEYAFSETFIAKLTVEDGVKEIGKAAFASTLLSRATLPASISSIGEKAFGVVNLDLKDIYYAGTIAQWKQIAASDVVMYYITTVHCQDGDILPAPSERCGDDLTWSLDANGVLTVTGTGDMWDFYEETQPWYDRKAEIKSVVLGEGVTSVGDYAFHDYPSGFPITELCLPAGLREVGEKAFDGCTALCSVNLPESLETIGRWAFYGCNGLRSVVIPAGVETIGFFALSFCESLTEILVDSSNAYFCSINGALYTKDGRILIALPGGQAGKIIVPAQTTELGAGALSGASNVTEVTVSASVDKISDSAFQGCTGLNAVRFIGNAPEFGRDIFQSVNATVYYPENNGTWTESVRQNYGGTLAWQAVVSGDANGDGMTDILDLVRLLKYFASATDEIDRFGADLTGDGTVSTADLMYLRQILVGLKPEAA